MPVSAVSLPANEPIRRRGRPALPRRAVFLDKDGTLVEDVPFNVDPARLRFTAGTPQALARLAADGWRLIVVTNQPGLAQRRFTLPAFAALCEALCERLWQQARVRLDGIYACPHAPGRMPACRCRKPASGLLQFAAAVHGIALDRSWMIGDILNDVEAGRRAGCRTVLLDVGNETEWRRGARRMPRHRAGSMAEAAAIVIGGGGGGGRGRRGAAS